MTLNLEEGGLIHLMKERIKGLMIGLIFVVSISSYYAYNLPDVYISEVTLTPASNFNSSPLSGSLGNIAALAGVNLAGKGTDRVSVAIEVLGSRDFINNLITKYNLKVVLMATKHWDRTTGAIEIDPEIYDVTSKQWTRKVKPPRKPEPSEMEVYKYVEKDFNVAQEKLTGIVTLTMQHQSSEFAKEWLEKAVTEINATMKERDIEEANNNIKFLNQQLDLYSQSDIKNTIYSLIEDNVKTLMIANTRNDYVFKIIDRPYKAEKPLKPNRPLMIIISIISYLIFVYCFLYLKSKGK